MTFRCPLKIQGNGLTPSQCAINQAAEISGRYAAIAQVFLRKCPENSNLLYLRLRALCQSSSPM